MSIVKKNLACAVGLLVLGMAISDAQPTSAPPAAVMTSTNGIGPKIQFATPIYDFGRVRSGELVKYTYVFTNTGDRMLMVTAVQPGCHCTTAGEWTKQVTVVVFDPRNAARVLAHEVSTFDPAEAP